MMPATPANSLATMRASCTAAPGFAQTTSYSASSVAWSPPEPKEAFWKVTPCSPQAGTRTASA
eukprot:5569761-Alexandrium_andersonii.AAC.1